MEKLVYSKLESVEYKLQNGLAKKPIRNEVRLLPPRAQSTNGVKSRPGLIDPKINLRDRNGKAVCKDVTEEIETENHMA
ncbi:MAG: hypothetical protein ACKO96_00090 [Flammeovirgaceae bacterium]